MKMSCVLLLALCTIGLTVGADVVFVDDFENEPLIESGNPLGWVLFGAPIDDRGTYTAQYHSPSASVWVAMTWTGWGWGAQTTAGTYNVQNNQTTLSCWMRANNNFTVPSVALSIWDADGTQWRTADPDLFQVTTTWTKYSTVLSGMVVEAAGSVAGLDYANIVNFGFLAYTAGQSGQNTMQYDDYSVDTIPEPSSLVAGLAGVVLLALRRRAAARAARAV